MPTLQDIQKQIETAQQVRRAAINTLNEPAAREAEARRIAAQTGQQIAQLQEQQREALLTQAVDSHRPIAEQHRQAVSELMQAVAAMVTDWRGIVALCNKVETTAARFTSLANDAAYTYSQAAPAVQDNPLRTDFENAQAGALRQTGEYNKALAKFGKALTVVDVLTQSVLQASGDEKRRRQGIAFSLIGVAPDHVTVVNSR